MRTAGAALLLSASAAFPAACALAQAPADSARRAALAGLPAGALVRLREEGDVRRQGTVVALRGDSLELRDTWRGRPYAVGVSRVAFVEVRARGDRKKGATIGALVGATLGAISAGAGERPGDAGGGLIVGSAAMNGLVGGAIGYFLSREGWRQVWPTPAAVATSP